MRYVIRSEKPQARGEPIGWLEAKDPKDAASVLRKALSVEGHPHFHHADDPDLYSFEELPKGADPGHYETSWDMPLHGGAMRQVQHVFNLAQLGGS